MFGAWGCALKVNLAINELFLRFKTELYKGKEMIECDFFKEYQLKQDSPSRLKSSLLRSRFGECHAALHDIPKKDCKGA